VLTDGALTSVNVIGSWSATTGLSEAARRVASALIRAKVNVALEDFDYGAPRSAHRLPTEFRDLLQGRLYGIDLIFLNVNEMLAMPTGYLDEGNHYTIGFWYWELPNVPPVFQSQFSRVDEIWVASNFVRDAFIQYTDKPIFVFPAIVEVDELLDLEKDDLGLDDERFTFLFNFDANSTFARKNPWGVIEAFRKAFTHAERTRDVQLVIKSINLDLHSEGRDRLRQEVDSVNGLLLDIDMSRYQMMNLLNCCDSYVSLHRAEGFGLGMAEAMYLGRPVIATGYSGNTDFTKLSNSCQVGYSLREITVEELRFNRNAEHTYCPGLLWADPDVGQAARWMRILYENSTLRTRIGEAGSRYVRSELRSETVGQKMSERLQSIVFSESL
jgi:glycosyltransferase involved in cell wall biosynthesis